ncbi:MAG: guanylate kinase [Bacteroidota bacterium]
MEGKLVIISAPSGAGKTTIVKHLLDSGLNLSFSVSATTRQLRGKEADGVDYFYLTVPEFKRKIENNEFVEWEEVYKDLFYGSLKSELERIWANGNHVLFDVDVMGGINLKKKFGVRSIVIFIMPPSIEELKKRLVKRGDDCLSKINMRVEKAREEIRLADQFDTIIINDQLEKAKEQAFNIVSSFIEI